MRLTRTLAPAIAIALLLAVVAVAQQITSLNASAKGKGTITISDIDKHEITSVRVVLKEDLCHELAATADSDLGEDGLEMILDRVWGKVEVVGYLLGGEASKHETSDLALAFGKPVRFDDQGGDLRLSDRMDHHPDMTVWLPV